MTPEQAAKVLAVAATYDQRLTPPTREDALARSLAWAQALRPDMSPEWAQQAVVAHYAEHTTVLMPAHLNSSWKSYRRAEIERSQHSALMATTAEGVPMPDEVRALWRSLSARVGAE